MLQLGERALSPQFFVNGGMHDVQIIPGVVFKQWVEFKLDKVFYTLFILVRGWELRGA